MTGTHHQRYKSTEVRFWEKVDKTGDCWEWTANRSDSGYGIFSFNNLSVRAHRMVLMLEGQTIPSGMCVCHRCDNPGCVNPDHLFIADHATNMADMASKGRNASLRGSAHGRATLDENDVIVIKGLLSSGCKTHHIAKFLDIKRVTITAINTGRNWRHI